MKKNSNFKSKKMTLLTICVLAVLIISGIFAYLTDTDDADNVFTVGNINITLSEPNWSTTDSDTDGIPDAAEDFVSNQIIKKDPKITNDGNNDAYVFLKVRVPMVKGAVINSDNSGNAQHQTLHTDGIAQNTPNTATVGEDTYTDIFTLQKYSGSLDATNNTELKTSEYTQITTSNGDWKVIKDYTETNGASGADLRVYHTYVYAYKDAIEPAEVTTTLFDAIKVVNFTGNEAATVANILSDNIAGGENGQHILVNAFGVQADHLDVALISADYPDPSDTNTTDGYETNRALWRTQFKNSADKVNNTSVNLTPTNAL